MKHLLSLPKNSTDSFYSFRQDSSEFFSCSDPPEGKVGSGGGTSWILSESYKADRNEDDAFTDWLSHEKRVIIHGGGQSRRLPSYAPLGKSFLPMPVFRWERGQRLDQTLLDLQLPLLDNLLDAAHENTRVLIASGDALILSDRLFDNLPDADVISIGMSVDPALASNHGVFVCSRKHPESLCYMLQKPDKETLKSLNIENLFYIDTGIWLLSEKAVNIIMKRSGWLPEQERYSKLIPSFYDLYGSFGLALGDYPQVEDEEINSLSTAILPLSEGNFYHFGTSSELISSSLEIQNRVLDPRNIWTKNIKPHPSIFTQNCIIESELSQENRNLWIENSWIGSGWKIRNNHIITGIPENEWNIDLPENICIDIIPVKGGKFCIRLYGIGDRFRGRIDDNPVYMGSVFDAWLETHNLTPVECGFSTGQDIYELKLFPVLPLENIDNDFISWIISGGKNESNKTLWLGADRCSSSDLLDEADLVSLEKQRRAFLGKNIKGIYKNYRKSVFFQCDIDYASSEYKKAGHEFPPVLNEEDPSVLMQDMMFRARLCSSENDITGYKRRAFGVLQQAVIEPIIEKKQMPGFNVYEDQIVWARSPVRIDLAGGWTDTPPNCNLNGGTVVNVALELNGQPPLQAFIRPSQNRNIILRSIDLGAREVVESFEDLRTYDVVGSPFSIPKAAFALAGFLPEYCSYEWKTLKDQLEDLGSGIEISFLAAVPKGSGLGTSSILAATILGAISDFTGLGWDQFEICNRTLALEQLLTTGGGWQDQYGGIVSGLKLLTTQRGWNQSPDIRWLPDFLFTRPEYKDSMLLYYTGITRVAKNILSEIVEGMFLNRHETYEVIKQLKKHAEDTYNTIQRGRYEDFGRKIARSWSLNKRLDSGTNNEHIQSIIDLIDDYCIGYKLPGAGGGGFLYIAAKDPEAAVRIRKILTERPPNKRARFVDMDISQTGLQISRS